MPRVRSCYFFTDRMTSYAEKTRTIRWRLLSVTYACRVSSDSLVVRRVRDLRRRQGGVTWQDQVVFPLCALAATWGGV